MSEKDNTELKPAEENPWYVLATICDKKDKDDNGIIVNGRAIEKCEVWNTCLRHLIDEPFRASLIGQDPYIPLFDSPKWDDIKEVVVERFEKRTNGSKLPSLTNIVDFSNTCFSKKVDFKNFVFFSTANFNGSTFENEVDFEGAFFLSHANFHKKTIFQERANFRDVTFYRNAVFTQAEFHGEAIFGLSVFKDQVDFQNAQFLGNSNFAKCEFKMPCDFYVAKFHTLYPVLLNTTFRKKITLSAKINLKEITYWPDLQSCQQNPEEAKYSCEVLREQMEAQGLHEQAHFFFRREMHFARKTGSFWQAIPNWLFYVVSDYGYSILLPFVWLYNFWMGGALIFLQFTELTKFKSLGLSISNLLQITGLQRVYWSDVIECLPSWLKFLGGLQTLLAIPLLFLLLLGLRNRFRLK
jgi:uncharacterized protein YjbI with pentapeptide repeats